MAVILGSEKKKRWASTQVFIDIRDGEGLVNEYPL